MSVFEKFFKLSNTRIEDEHQKKMNLLMQVTNSKMTEKEVERVYKTLDEEIIKKMPRNVQIIEAMEMIQKMKGDWLTEEEKENIVAGVWMFDTLKSEEKNKNYINPEQLKYVKQAVLGNQFKAAKAGKYYAEIQDYKLKY